VTAVLRELEYPDDPKAWTDADREALARAIRRRTKPIVVVANKVDAAPEGRSTASARGRTSRWSRSRRTESSPCAAPRKPASSTTTRATGFDVVGDISDGQREGLEAIRGAMAEYGGTGVQTALNAAVYDLLDRITVFPVQDASKWTDGTGNVLPDAFLLPAGATPPDLAYAVHTDIGEGYLHAVDARSSRRIGESHELSEGDVVKIVSTDRDRKGGGRRS